jgi:hypothetical protein
MVKEYMNYSQIYGGYDYEPERRQFSWSVLINKTISFFIGCLAVAVIYALGFKTSQNINGWINQPIITPIAGQSAQLK